MEHLADETLQEYLDELLDAPQRAVVEAHLADCAVCRAELAGLRELFTLLAAPADAALPADLRGPVLRQIAPPRWSWRAWLLLLVQLALSAALLLWLAPDLAARAAAVDLGQLAAALGAAAGLPGLPTAAPTIDPLALAGLLPTFDVGPLAGLRPTEWALALGAAGALWLAAHTLLLSSRTAHREVRR